MKKTACSAPSPSRRFAWISLLGAAALLAGCYVVPLNPSTGLPYPVPPQTAAQPAAVSVYTAPANPTTLLQAKLYPLNAPATKAGTLIATAVDGNNGRGVFTVAFMGETLQGDASRVDGNYPGFGRLYREVLGIGAEAGKGGRRGIANAFGPNGTSVQCEYQMTASDIGTGVCLFSNGAKYQMHFGS